MINRKKMFQTGVVWIGLASLLGEHRRHFLRLIKHIFTDYFVKQYGRQPAIYIDAPLDKDICVYPRAINTYFNFIPLLLGSLGYVQKEFGTKVKDDVDRFIEDLIDLYGNAGFVFENTPTILGGRSSKGVGLKILHFFDRPRNYFPSLHVILVSYAYFQTCRIIDKYSGNENHMEVRGRLFNRSVSIIESCLLIKQHGIRDIAGGLALITLKDAGFSFEVVEKIVSAMFRDNLFGMDSDLIYGVRSDILSIYREIISRFVTTQTDGFYAQPLVSYVKSI